MHVKNHIVWLSYTMAVVVSVSLAFTLDPTTSHISTMEDFFRNKVLQMLSSKNKGDAILTGLPTCMVCKHENSNVGNVCYKMTDQLQQVYQDWTKKTVDLVFLFDGSGSMTEAEFNKNKDFIVDIINSLKNSSIKFAAVQFSTEFRQVFDFNDYEAGTALQKLKDEPHMRTLTNTHKALTFVLDHLFENPSAGASPDATNVLVMITDGDPSDLDRNNIVQRYAEKNIIRFVIGVKQATMEKFKTISSQPTVNYAFKIENYDGLTGILESFQQKMSVIEGSNVAQSGVFFKVSFPNVVHSYHENYLNSVCYKTTDRRQQVPSLISACRDWTKKTVDLVFLFDGSGSMTEAEFNKNKDFIVDIINSLKNSSIKFAAVQFSTEFRQVFDFNDYEAGTALQKLKDEPHMRTLTNTHKALTFVLDHLFENPSAGASPDATKVLVMITDGDPSDLDRNNIFQRYAEKNIIRFVIGVKHATMEKFKTISSQPTVNYAFKIENYDGLTGILESFQQKMSVIEGSNVAQSGVFFKVSFPNVVHSYHENYLNSVCYKTTDRRQQVPSLISACRDWTKKTVDLVFLFDGSGSMTEAEFNKNKDFIVDIINSLKNSSIKFAAVQFSTDLRKVFDFNDYEAGTALQKLKDEPHMRTLTNTHKALTFVLDHLFENPSAGASPDATKVLVMITDGDPSDLDKNNIVQRYAEKNIIRFVIGVKHARVEKFKTISSQPTVNYAFKIENYDGLTGILESFQQKMSVIEGSNVAQSGVFFKVSFPNVVHSYHENYLNSVCYKTTDRRQQVPSLISACRECTKKTVDLVFLFDGSGSMTEAEFNKNKDFIVDIINSLKNSSIKFAAVQFSTEFRQVFDFNDYEAGTALQKLKDEPHMRTLTNTHKALTFVLDHLFENPSAGASPDATKVLVMITDGDPSDLDRNNIFQRYAEKNIIRFVIGVKHATMEKFKTISSQPTENYSFKIENYDGLTGILESFQKKIFVIEGRQNNDLHQSGLSAVFFNDTLMIGSLRSNSWRGSFREIHEARGTRIENPDMQMDSYMGHSICIGRKNNDLLYFTGAPRSEQTGQVVVFRHNCMNWSPGQRLKGAQIGSYFGAELCSVDIDSDGNTDFLLVGAPLFHQPQEKTEGQVYIFRLTDEMQLESEVNVTAPSMGRFGTAIASLADLNGDGLRDVAVGAPLEDDGSGAVYIYLGDRHRGTRSTFSQRITGQQIQPGLRFFGQALDGDMDTGEDGLRHIVIGSQGTAVVLRFPFITN